MRGWALFEAIARLNVDVCDVGDKKTYSRNGAEYIIDVTFWSPDQNPSLDWRVDDRYTPSDHLAIQCRVEDGHSRRSLTVIEDG